MVTQSKPARVSELRTWTKFYVNDPLYHPPHPRAWRKWIEPRPGSETIGISTRIHNPRGRYRAPRLPRFPDHSAAVSVRAVGRHRRGQTVCRSLARGPVRTVRSPDGRTDVGATPDEVDCETAAARLWRHTFPARCLELAAAAAAVTLSVLFYTRNNNNNNLISSHVRVYLRPVRWWSGRYTRSVGMWHGYAVYNFI